MRSVSDDQRGVRAYRSPGRQVFRSLAIDGMAPGRRDLGQWPHHKQPFSRAGMRHDQTRATNDPASIGDQVQIEGPWRVGVGPATAKVPLNAKQSG